MGDNDFECEPMNDSTSIYKPMKSQISIPSRRLTSGHILFSHTLKLCTHVSDSFESFPFYLNFSLDYTIVSVVKPCTDLHRRTLYLSVLALR